MWRWVMGNDYRRLTGEARGWYRELPRTKSSAKIAKCGARWRQDSGCEVQEGGRGRDGEAESVIDVRGEDGDWSGGGAGVEGRGSGSGREIWMMG